MDSEEEYSENRDRSKFRKSGQFGWTPTKLDPDPRFMEREATFRQEHFSKDLLPWVEKLETKLEPLKNEKAFLPQDTSSIRFRLNNTHFAAGTDDAEHSLKRFEAKLFDNNSVIFTGGPVWAMAWVPQPGPNTTQFLALSTHRTHAQTPYSDSSAEPGFIQVWKIKIDKEQNLTDVPVLSLGIGHCYGKIWGLDWCPSGIWEDAVTLGGLAAACSDGTVKVIKVQYPRKGRRYLKSEKNKTLTPGTGSQGHCLSVCWYRGPGHRYLAASFISGLVGVWDLAAESPILDTEAGTLPILSWLAHSSSVTGVSFATSDTEFPQYCVTGGSDRSYRFWDLRDTCTPIQEVKRGMVTSVSWIPGQPAAAVSHDDVYLQAHTQTLVTESGFSRTGSQPIIGQNSCVWDQSVSAWLGGLAVCTAAGELVLYMMPDGTRAVDQNKSSGRRRTYVYVTKNISEPSPANIVDENENAKRVSTLLFQDLWNQDNLAGPDKEMKAKVRYSEKMDSEDLLMYPVSSLNRVSWNPNLGAHLLLGSGGQSGLVRINCLSSLNTQEIKTTEQTVIKNLSL